MAYVGSGEFSDIVTAGHRPEVDTSMEGTLNRE